MLGFGAIGETAIGEIPVTNPALIRIEAIAASLFGKLLDHDDDFAEVEIPADMLPSAWRAFGGNRAIIIGQRQDYTSRRVPSGAGFQIDNTAVDLMTFYRFKIELTPHAVRTEDAPAGAIGIMRAVGPGR